MDILKAITVVVPMKEGLVYGEPVVFAGHLNLEEATAIARELGKSYPVCCCVPCSPNEAADFYANYSNEDNPPMEDGVVEIVEIRRHGHLELFFYLTQCQFLFPASARC